MSRSMGILQYSGEDEVVCTTRHPNLMHDCFVQVVGQIVPYRPEILGILPEGTQRSVVGLH